MIRDSLPTDGRRLSRTAEWLSSALRRRVAIDRRALAAFRIALGTLLLVDLALRSRNLTEFYTDSGVLPREAFFADYANIYTIHALSGDAWFQWLLFLVAGAFAIALIVGYRTRLATFVSWLLLLSLHIRNPMILNGGDSLLRMLCFWAMFVPLGDRWSIDASRTDNDRSVVATIGTMALLLQVVLMYVTNAVHKVQGELWLEGEALPYIFGADQFTILLGNHLVEFPALLRVMTYAWLVLIVASPLLILATGVPRAALATAFVGMHLGMLVTLRIDLFPLIVVAGLVPFYPPIVWDGAERFGARLGNDGATSRLADRLGRRAPVASLPDTLPRVSDVTRAGVRSPFPRGAAAGRETFATVIPWFFLTLVVLSNAQAVDYAEVPDPADEVLDVTKSSQSWRMFAPDPLRTTRWYVAPGELENGTEVDALHDSQVELDRPHDVDETFETARWRKYLGNVRSAGNTNHHSYLANHLCTRWNATHETGLETVTIAYGYERHDPYDDTDSASTVELLEYECGGPLVQGDDEDSEGSGSDGPRITVEVTSNNETRSDDLPYDSR